MATAVGVNATGNSEIDGLLSGSKWSGAITFSFPDSTSDYPSSGYSQKNEPAQTGFGPAPAAMQAAINYAVGLIQGYTNIQISYAGTNGADLQIAQSSAANPTSHAYYPGNYSAGGDIWFGTGYNYANAKLGNYLFATALHELGHALGLKHSQETGGPGNVAVPYAHDNSEYSIMSYRSYAGAPLTGYTAETWGFSQTYMANDILALQTMYGANYNTQSTNTTYTWSTTTGQMFINGVAQLAPGDGTGGSQNRVFETIWDGNGIDTYDMSNYATAVSINLNPGASSITSTAQLAYLGNGNYAAGNVYNAYLFNGDTRSLIENAIGGSAGDTLVGNVAANNLNGGGGNDTVTGGAGNDTIVGGSGTDKAVYSGNKANYLITYNSGTQTFTIVDQRGGSPDGTDTVTGVENFQFLDGVYTSSQLMPTNSAPVVTANSANVTASAGQVIQASSLFTVTDPDNDVLTYFIYDSSSAANSGHWVVKGATIAAGTVVALSAADLAQTTFVAGASGSTDAIAMLVYDGQTYSGNPNFTYMNVNVPGGNTKPVVTATSANVAATAGQVIQASSLFTVTDPDNDVLTYFIYDSSSAANSGHWEVKGSTIAAGTVVALSAADLAQTTFVAGASGSTDSIAMLAYDGQTYSGNPNFTYMNVNVPAGNTKPVVTATSANVGATAGQVIQASSLFTVTDPDNDVLTYFLYDASSAANSGHWVVKGSTIAAGTVVALSASDLAQTTFVAGAAGTTDSIAMLVYDGHTYSGNPNFTYLNVNVGSGNAPVAASGPDAHGPDPFPIWTPEGVVPAGFLGTGNDAFVFGADDRLQGNPAAPHLGWFEATDGGVYAAFQGVVNQPHSVADQLHASLDLWLNPHADKDFLIG